MQPIPHKIKEQLAAEPRMWKCAIDDGSCYGRIQWHHPWIYAGKQINEAWAIVPACEYHHNLVNGDQEIKKRFMVASLRIASDEDLKKYPGTDWNQTKKFLGLSREKQFQFHANESKEEAKQRTLQQNKALHLFFTMVADRLNDAGLDMRTVLKPDIEIPWSGSTVKNYLWRPVQKLQLGKKSTTELTTKDIDVIYDTLNRHLAKFGIHEPFPSLEEIMAQQRIYEKRTRKN